ncbi:unnamed protein product, partial [Didymodactylos carnosus]
PFQTSYRQRSEDFKRIFNDLPREERLIVDYSCAWQKEILIQGRMFLSQNYLCFHANFLKWETNPLSSQQLWTMVHESYGDYLDMTTDEEDNYHLVRLSTTNTQLSSNKQSKSDDNQSLSNGQIENGSSKDYNKNDVRILNESLGRRMMFHSMRQTLFI